MRVNGREVAYAVGACTDCGHAIRTLVGVGPELQGYDVRCGECQHINWLTDTEPPGGTA